MTTQKSSSRFPNPPFSANPDGLRPVTEGPMKFYATMWNEALRQAARALHDQADYVQKLSECSDPAEALRCHGEFVQQSWTRSINEGSKMFSALQANISSSST